MNDKDVSEPECAENIYDRLRTKYEMCRTYTDKGFVDFVDVKENPERIQFRTTFERPSYVAFEWQDYGPRRGKTESFCLLWSDQGETVVRYVWGAEPAQSLSLAIAGATGCSAGAASVAINLLSEEARRGSKSLAELADLERLADEELCGENCYVLRGSMLKKGDQCLWVSKETFALLRVRDDRSETAEEAELQYEKLVSDKDLVNRMKAMGIAPPAKMIHRDLQFVTEYTFTEIVFDAQVNKLAKP